MWQTKRRMRRDLAGAHADRDQARRDLAKATAEHDDQLRQLGRQLADRDQRIAEVETHNTNLRAQLDFLADATPGVHLTGDDDLADEVEILDRARRLCSDP